MDLYFSVSVRNIPIYWPIRSNAFTTCRFCSASSEKDSTLPFISRDSLLNFRIVFTRKREDSTKNGALRSARNAITRS